MCCARNVVMFIFCILFLLSQVILLICGTYIEGAGVYIAAVFGIVIAGVGIFAAFKNIKWVVLAVVIVVTILAIYYGVMMAKSIISAKDQYEELDKAANAKVEDMVVPEALEDIQKKYKCCGVKGPADFEKIVIPDSCYPEGKKGDKEAMYKNGCEKNIVEHLTIPPAAYSIAFVCSLPLLITAIIVCVLSFRSD